jgi:hypothetical protein
MGSRDLWRTATDCSREGRNAGRGDWCVDRNSRCVSLADLKGVGTVLGSVGDLRRATL